MIVDLSEQDYWLLKDMLNKRRFKQYNKILRREKFKDFINKLVIWRK
jgi:hypothetical protein